MNLSLTLRAIAQRLPDRPALTWEKGALSYALLAREVERIAGALRRRHALQPGARVALAMDNCPEFLPALYAIWRAGLTAVPLNSRLHAREMAWILADSQARLCLVSTKIAEALSAPGLASAPLPPLVAVGTADFAALRTAAATAPDPAYAPEAEAWLFYTSGTTGRPKGAILTHRNLLFACHCYYADIDQLGPDDTIVHAAPLTHGSGLYGLAHIARGSHNVILSGSFDPERVFKAFAAHRNVAMFAAPTMVSRLINHSAAGGDTRGLKTMIYGGAAMYLSDLRRALALFGPKLYQLYGQGESPMTITGLDKAAHADADHPLFQARLRSAGVARTGVAVKVLDDAGRELAPGEVGEIATRSDCVMQGYWNNVEATARALREGWLWTGDLGSLDEAGFLTIKDRSKDMIISGGSNIYPREIEELLLTAPGVLEVAVVGRPHGEWGEEVVAFVVAREGAEVAVPALDRLCLDNIARYKRPRAYRFVGALPKNNYGKILKTELRQALQDEAAGGARRGDDR
jgi:long-chain acyl-CoA synthetase